MLSFLHTPPTSPSPPIKESSSPVYNPPQIKTEYTGGFWDIGSPDSETDCNKRSPDSETDCNKRPLKENYSPNKRVKIDYETEERYMECKKLFKSQEDVTQVMSLLRKRKNLDLKDYSHEGMFIPNILLALSQTPRLDAPITETEKSMTVTNTFTVTNTLTEPTRGKDCSRPYVCEYCGKRFTNIGNLATHSRTHTKEKPYKCSKCDLEFAHTSNLQRHQLVHSGQRNNKCPYCDKCFSRSDYLKVHERTHTGEKPYACTVTGCTKRFLDSSSLKKHERTHTGLRPFSCQICDKSYTEASKLKTHLLQHKEGNQKVCNVCNETFTRPADFRRHLRTHAKIGPAKAPSTPHTQYQYSFHPYQLNPQQLNTQQLNSQQAANFQQYVEQTRNPLIQPSGSPLTTQPTIVPQPLFASFPGQQQQRTQVTRPSPQRPVPAAKPVPNMGPILMKSELIGPQSTSLHNTLVSSLMGQDGIPIYPKTTTLQRPLPTRPMVKSTTPYTRIMQFPSNTRVMTSSINMTSQINVTQQINVSTRCSAFLPVQWELC